MKTLRQEDCRSRRLLVKKTHASTIARLRDTRPGTSGVPRPDHLALASERRPIEVQPRSLGRLKRIEAHVVPGGRLERYKLADSVTVASTRERNGPRGGWMCSETRVAWSTHHTRRHFFGAPSAAAGPRSWRPRAVHSMQNASCRSPLGAVREEALGPILRSVSPRAHRGAGARKNRERHADLVGGMQTTRLAAGS